MQTDRPHLIADWIWRINAPTLICLAVLAMLLPQMAILKLLGLITGSVPVPPGLATRNHLVASIIVLGLLVPIYETLFGQLIIIRLVIYFAGSRYWLAIAVSGLAFGIAHGFVGWWLAILVFNGCVLAGVFVFQRYRGRKPFLTTYLVHAVYNVLALSAPYVG